MNSRPKTLRGITWEHPRGFDCLVASARTFFDVTGVDVSWEQRSLQAFAETPLEQLAIGYDLLVIDHPHIPGAVGAGALAPLDDAGFDAELVALGEQSVGPSHPSYAHRGHQYGLATDAAAQVAVYRPDLIPEPPRTWEEVLQLARQGRVLWPAKPIDAYSSLITVAASHGCVLQPEPGVFLSPEDAAWALDLLHQLTSVVPVANRAHNPIQVAELLCSQDQWAYCPLLFGYSNYSRQGFRRSRLRYVDIPAGVNGSTGSLLGGAGIAVSAYTKHVDAAREFAFWVASADVQRGVYFDAGGQPGHRAAWEDDRLNGETLDFFRGTRATLEGAYVRPRSAGYIGFQDHISPLVTAALSGEISDRKLITTMNDYAGHLLEGPSHADI